MEHGPPLILKCDNGSAFIAEETQSLLTAWGILPLYSPPQTPSYNGACEAAGGSLKSTTEDLACLHGRSQYWATCDAERARNIRNELGRPWGHRGPTPSEAWHAREAIPAETRQEFANKVQCYRRYEIENRGLTENVLSRAARASINRYAISRALQEHGYLSYRVKLITPPIKSLKVAKIM